MQKSILKFMAALAGQNGAAASSNDPLTEQLMRASSSAKKVEPLFSYDQVRGAESGATIFVTKLDAVAIAHMASNEEQLAAVYRDISKVRHAHSLNGGTIITPQSLINSLSLTIRNRWAHNLISVEPTEGMTAPHKQARDILQRYWAFAFCARRPNAAYVPCSKPGLGS